MLAELITLTRGRRYGIIACHNAKVRISVRLIMNVKTPWNSTLELLERSYLLWKCTRQWLQNPNYTTYRPLFTTQEKRTIVKYDMEVLGRFRYWTRWMCKRHSVTFHHLITVYHDVFDHMDGVMQALAETKTKWKEDLFFAVMLD
jgi:hypothetical protein